MANVTITPVKTKEPNAPIAYTYQALTSGDVAVVNCGFKDEHTQFHFLGGSSPATVTIKAGNSYAGVNDEVFEVPASGNMALTIDSNRFKNVSGEHVGKVLIEVSAGCSMAVIAARV